MYDTAAELFVAGFLFAYVLAFAILAYWTVRTWAGGAAAKAAEGEGRLVTRSSQVHAPFAIPSTSPALAASISQAK